MSENSTTSPVDDPDMTEILADVFGPDTPEDEENKKAARKAALEGAEDARKDEEIRKFEREAKYQDVIQRQEHLKKIEGIDLSQQADEALLEFFNREHEELVYALKNKHTFINKALTEVTPLWPGNITLVGGQTGHGKSTATANIIESLFKEQKKVLLITNEEVALDCYNRVACLMLNLNYADLESFSEEQHAQLKELRAQLVKYITIIDNNYKGIADITTSIEGVESILESLITRNAQYDVIVIDYYQNVAMSKRFPRKERFTVLADFSNYLDAYRKRYKAPIVVFAQIHPKTKEKQDFESRVKEGKSIVMKASIIWEIRPDYDDHATDWLRHKLRHMKGTEPALVRTPFKYGRYCEPSIDFLLDENGELLSEEEKAANANATEEPTKAE